MVALMLLDRCDYSGFNKNVSNIRFLILLFSATWGFSEKALLVAKEKAGFESDFVTSLGHQAHSAHSALSTIVANHTTEKLCA